MLQLYLDLGRSRIAHTEVYTRHGYLTAAKLEETIKDRDVLPPCKKETTTLLYWDNLTSITNVSSWAAAVTIPMTSTSPQREATAQSPLRPS